MPRLFVLDALGLAYRAHYAFIRRPLINSRGEHTSALFGFANTVLKIRREERPDYWALAWDGPGPTHRHLRYADYKATRKPMPAELLAQIPAIEDMAQALGLPVIEVPGVEADDVMATLARRGERDGFEVVLVTSDKDLAQLVNDRVRLLSPTGRGEEYTWVDRAAVHEKWSVAPEQTRDVLALMGDTSDNIPGVPGIGSKTAAELIREFGSLDAVYRELERVPRASVRENLRAHREQAYLSRELATVLTDCEIGRTWEELRRAPIRKEALGALAKRYELQRLERLAEAEGVDDATAGPPAPARDPALRGSAAETEAPGVKLMIPESRVALPDPPLVVLPLADLPPPHPPLAAPEPPLAALPPPERPFDLLHLEAPAPVAPPAEPGALPPWPRVESVPRSAVQAAQGNLDLWSGNGAGSSSSQLEIWRERLHEVRARAIHGLAVLPLGSTPDPRRARLVGLALAARGGATAYVPLGHDSGPNFTLEQARAWLGLALGDPTVPKVGEDLKGLAHLLAGAGIALDGFGFDVHIGSFLCDPDRDHRLVALARDFLGISCVPLADALAQGRPRGPAHPGALDPERAAQVLEPLVQTLFPLAEALRAQLESREQWALYESLEHPLIPVLLEMEQTGIHVDVPTLHGLADQAAAEIARLEEELFRLSGERINLNSGPQLATVLFERLGLKAGRRTKTGFSTDQAVLEELAPSHPFPARLLEYRALTKLKSTYLDALPQVVDPRDGRVHTTFNPIGAATGRLSSSNPNLQNIPIRSPQGRAVRRAFVAPRGSVLVGADYSQIELRLMAHLSGDPNLIEAFRSGEDVHASTARKIFGVSGDLDPALRARAKIVNFGIMYGMGARSLSQQMKIPLPDAQEFIRSYFRVFAGVREYLDRQVERARERGWVQTLFGRRRWLHALASPNGGERSLAERIAINAPIQGSAADLMKLAMIRVHRALKQVAPSARLLLQVHDELLLEAPEELADAVATRVRAEMEGCTTLRVPLEVSVGRGATWFDVH